MLDNKKKLLERVEEIRLLIHYAVPAEDHEGALGLVDIFSKDAFALNVIWDFYRSLPDAREEALVKISVVEEKEQVYLFLLSTAGHHHLYLTNEEGGVFLGPWQGGLQDRQVLGFFDYSDPDAFTKSHSSMAECREYCPLERMNEALCPSCGVGVGSLHTLGCPVELCPWCGGQLNHCNCRFEQLGVDVLDDETRLEELQEKLEKKGRISYATEQRPSFLSE